MSVGLRKVETVDESTQRASTQAVAIALSERQNTVVDDNANKLLTISMALHLLEIGTSSEGNRPCRTVTICLLGFDYTRIGQRFRSVVQT